MRIGMTYDLRDEYLAAGYGEEATAEFDSPETVAAIRQALERRGHEVVPIGNLRALADLPTGPQRQLAIKFRMTENRLENIRQASRLTVWVLQAVDAIMQELGQGTAIGRHDGKTGSHGCEHQITHELCPSRDDQQMGMLEKLRI